MRAFVIPAVSALVTIWTLARISDSGVNGLPWAVGTHRMSITLSNDLADEADSAVSMPSVDCLEISL